MDLSTRNVSIVEITRFVIIMEDVFVCLNGREKAALRRLSNATRAAQNVTANKVSVVQVAHMVQHCSSRHPRPDFVYHVMRIARNVTPLVQKTAQLVTQVKQPFMVNVSAAVRNVMSAAE